MCGDMPDRVDGRSVLVCQHSIAGDAAALGIHPLGGLPVIRDRLVDTWVLDEWGASGRTRPAPRAELRPGPPQDATDLGRVDPSPERG